MTTKHQVNALPRGYPLHWYEIIEVIGEGGFGITYLARDNNLHVDVAIKEYMPEDFASRIDENTVLPREDRKSLYQWGLERFVTEARTLARFDHPNIVRVLNVFEQNGTAYMVMKYAKGEDLSKIYKKREPFTEEEFLDVFIPIMDGLALIHNAGYIHRDIKPANIYICENETPILLDFGSARQAISRKTKALTTIVTYGYAPIEQYGEDSGKQGPWSDIFALGASMYAGITGEAPVNVSKRSITIIEKDIDPIEPLSVVAAGRYSDNFLLAIDNALMFKAEDRPQNIQSWAQMLLGHVAAPALPEYVLRKEVIDSAATVVVGEEDRSQPTTGPSGGSLGLVDAHGRRAPGSEQSDRQAQRDSAAKVTTSVIRGDLKQSKHGSRLLTFFGFFKSRLAIAAGIGLVVILTLVYLTLQPTDRQKVASQEKQEKTVIDEATQRIDQWLTLAKQRQSQGKLFDPGEDNAHYFYTKILELDANHEVARKAIAGIHQQLIDDARDLINQQKITEAEQALKLVEQMAPGDERHAELTDLLQNAALQQQIGQLLAKATKALTAEHFTAPANDNAFYYYNRVKKLEPNNKQALNGLERVESALLTLAESNVKSNNRGKAIAYLDQIDRINPNSEQSKSLRALLARKAHQIQIDELLLRAEAQIKSKRFSTPRGNNAYETYQQVLALDSGNRQAKDGIADIKKIYKKRFDKHISASRFNRAQRDLNIMERIADGEPVTRQMKTALAVAEDKHIRNLMAEFKTHLESRNETRVKKISQFLPRREQIVEQMLEQYQSLEVFISNYRYIAQTHEATAKVELSNLIDKNGKPVTPGPWSKFSVRVARDSGEQFKVIW